MTGDHTSVIYGTHYPSRLFVGCLPPQAGAEDLGTFFSKYGNVVEAKVVLDGEGNSKRFGFVTFSKSESVEAVINGEEIIFQGKKINVGPAVKKNMEGTPKASKVSTKPTVAKPAPIPATSSHVPKTIIRRSPVESMQNNFNFNCDNTFRSVWGISNRDNSVWTPSTPQIDIQQEKQFSLLNQLRGYSTFPTALNNVGPYGNPYNNPIHAPAPIHGANMNYQNN